MYLASRYCSTNSVGDGLTRASTTSSTSTTQRRTILRSSSTIPIKIPIKVDATITSQVKPRSYSMPEVVSSLPMAPAPRVDDFVCCDRLPRTTGCGSVGFKFLRRRSLTKHAALHKSHPTILGVDNNSKNNNNNNNISNNGVLSKHGKENVNLRCQTASNRTQALTIDIDSAVDTKTASCSDTPVSMDETAASTPSPVYGTMYHASNGRSYWVKNLC